MGYITRRERPPTDEEHEALRRQSWEYGKAPSGLVGGSSQVTEFEITADRISKPPSGGLPDHQRLFILEVGADVRIGFELCFMQGAIALGSFPAQRVCVAFAVRQSGTGATEDASPSQAAISYRWCGAPVSIVEITDEERPPWDKLLPIYRLWALQAALEQLARKP